MTRGWGPDAGGSGSPEKTVVARCDSLRVDPDPPYQGLVAALHPRVGRAHKRTHAKRRRPWLDDRRAALFFIALTLAVLVGMAAFAIDLGWLYLNTSRVQRGADAGVLAGAVHLPVFPDQAASDAVDGANANGWKVGWVNGQQIPGGGLERLDWRLLNGNRMEVTLEAVVDTFFIRALGFDSVTIRRTATAEFKIEPPPPQRPPITP